MDDLLGLGKGTEKLISTVEKAFGTLYRPYGLRKDADAEAYRIKVVSAAKLEANILERIELARAEGKTNVILADGNIELEKRLHSRLKHQALQQQANIDCIVAGAIDQASPNPNSDEVDADWLQGFSERAKNVSSEQMQALWSRLLALEVNTPGKFSLRALDVLQKLTRREASAFQNASRLASTLSKDGKRSSIHIGASRDTWFEFRQEPEIDLHEIGLRFLDQVNLSQIGLLYEKSLMSGEFEKNEEFEIRFASTRLRLKANFSHVRLRSYSLTPVGSELTELIPSDEDPVYIAAITSKLATYFAFLPAG
jgi:uncharacterized repeat protein (TIGR03899 family)